MFRAKGLLSLVPAVNFDMCHKAQIKEKSAVQNYPKIYTIFRLILEQILKQYLPFPDTGKNWNWTYLSEWDRESPFSPLTIMIMLVEQWKAHPVNEKLFLTRFCWAEGERTWGRENKRNQKCLLLLFMAQQNKSAPGSLWSINKTLSSSSQRLSLLVWQSSIAKYA